MHGRDRQRSGYALESAIRELSLFRVVLLELVLSEADRERPENPVPAATIARVLLMHRAAEIPRNAGQDRSAREDAQGRQPDARPMSPQLVQ